MGKAKRVKLKKIEDEKREEQRRAEKRADRRDTMKVAAVAVAILLVIAIIVTSICLIVTAVRGTGNYLRKRESITSEHFTVNNAMMTYFFRSTLNSAISQITSYYDASTAMYYGLIPDTTSPLRDQTYSNTENSWYDQIMDSAVASVKSMLVLAEGAHAAGLDITEADQKRIDAFIDTLSDTAEESKKSLDKIITENFGLGVKESDLRDALKLYYLSQRFYSQTVNGIDVTEEEISDYYDEHEDEIKVVDYLAYTFKSSDENAAENAETLAAAKNEEEFKETLRSILEKTLKEDELDDAIEDCKVEKETYDKETEYSVWLFDDETKANDTKTIKAPNGNLTVYMLLTPSHSDDSETRNVRHILFSLSDYETEDECKAAAEAVLNEFKGGAADEDSFAKLAEIHSSDPGSYYNGGLYENVSKGQMVEEFEDWLFDEKREVGDCEIVKTSYGYHIMYYSGVGMKAWEASVSNTLRSEKYSDISEDLTAKYAVTVDEKKLGNIPDVA